MDGVSIAASIIGIATAGVQVSIKLVTLATQISTSSDRVSAIGNDISLTSGVLRQLGDLMTQKTTDGGISILNENGLETTRTSAAMCERIFSEIEKEVKRASEQLRRYKPGLGKMREQKIELSTTEKAKWPFLQPRIDGLRADLRDAKSTLILLLQVATLALNKRMADASMSVSEHQDLIRAVVALELERREGRSTPIKPPEVSSSSSSIKSSDIGIPNKTSPREKTSSPHRYLYPSVSLAQAGPNSTTGSTAPREDFSDSQKIGSLDLIASPENSQSRGLKPDNFLDFSVAKSPGLNIPPTIEHKRDRTVDPEYSPAPSECGNQTQRTHNSELQLFLLKPLVKDLYDRIELRWTVQDTDMQPLAIREYMNKNEKDEIPSVVEMLQQLHAYEQEMVESETPKGSGKSILSLKRTTTDIQTRDMLFKAVPGLQFVVQYHVRQSPPQGEGPFRQTIHRVSGRVGKLRRVSGRLDLLRHRVSGRQNLLRPPSTSDMRSNDYSRLSQQNATGPINLSCELEGQSPGQALPLPSQPTIRVSHSGQYEFKGIAESDEESFLRDQDESFLDEEAEAEAMVNGLLEQYTTLFNS